MILAKNYQILNLDPVLIEILEAMDEQFGPGLCTSAYRPGDKGVHGTLPCRGYDRRCRDQGTGNYIAYWVNKQWIYDPERPDKQCAIWHDNHLHLQAHPNTRKFYATA